MDKLNKLLIAGAATLSFSAVSIEACEEQTAAVSSHVSAGRAEAVESCNLWGFCSTSDHLTVGGGDSLGAYTWATKTLYSTEAGVWNEGTCPAGPLLSVNTVSEYENEEGVFHTRAEGSVADPTNEVLGVQFRYVGVDQWDDWKNTLFESNAKTFNTGGIVGVGPALAKGSYQLEIRPIFGENQYGSVTSHSFNIANHAPICFDASVRSERSEDLYGQHVGFWTVADQDNNIDINEILEARLKNEGKDWAAGEGFFGQVYAVLTDAAGELTLGQQYTVEARVNDVDGAVTQCDDFVFTAEDTLGPRIVSTTLGEPARAQVELGATFDPFAAEYGLYAFDDYSAAEDIAIEYIGDVDTSAVGTYHSGYKVTDSAGNSETFAYAISVAVVDPATNHAPVIDSAYYTVIGEAQTPGTYNVGFTGSVSDVDGDFDSVLVRIVDENGEETRYFCDSINDFNCAYNFEAGTYTFTIFAEDDNYNRTYAASETITLGETGPACVEATLSEHVTAGRAYDQYFSYYATGTAAYLGSTFNDANKVVALEEQTAGSWTSVTSCP
ncbi:MAG: DUF5011 domain-containing protein [Agarilytica sp.]